MTTTRILDSSSQFVTEFKRCCEKYKSLDIDVAWCGDPKKKLPFQHLKPLGKNINILVGISFYHTHPEAIKWFMNTGSNIRIVKDSGPVFHPKIYLFRRDREYALFVGSSNFTYSGFYINHETNCLIEGRVYKKTTNHIAVIEAMMKRWRDDRFSFQPTANWLRGYRIRYRRAMEKQRRQKISVQPISDENTPDASWVRVGDWNVYYDNVVAGLERLGGGQPHHNVLHAAATSLRVPWTRQLFENIENRRIINGIGRYGRFGHAGAAGRLRELLASGTANEQRKIVQAINVAASFQPPLPFKQLERPLNSLVNLGPTMKVWSRLLCIVRSDIYCTIASQSVRRNLSEVLAIPQNRIEQVDGYVDVLRLIHASPWFNSVEPVDQTQAMTWRRRVAFLDAIFYE